MTWRSLRTKPLVCSGKASCFEDTGSGFDPGFLFVLLSDEIFVTNILLLDPMVIVIEEVLLKRLTYPQKLLND